MGFTPINLLPDFHPIVDCTPEGRGRGAPESLTCAPKHMLTVPCELVSCCFFFCLLLDC